MQLRRGRFGPFLSCSKYPDCDGLLTLDRKGAVKLPSAPPLVVDVKCPKCESPLNLRRSKRGPWLACSKFPKCRARLPWADLPKEKQAAFEKMLEAHEAANPQPTLHKLDGTEIGPGYDPVSNQTAPDAAANAAGPQSAGVNCPKCGKEMLIRNGKRGPFLTCSGFPRCRNAMDMDKLDELKSQQR